jgi:asparagine synthase (glutamine-hydrolysing)
MSDSVHPLPRSALRGTIDVGAQPRWIGTSLQRAVGDADAAPGRQRCRAPGLILDWDAGRASHAAAEDLLCVVWGTPRLAGDAPASADTVAPRATAAAILARYAARGTAALVDLRGAYGLLIVDARAARVVLACDRFAMETACHALAGDTFMVAERADEVPLSARTLSHQALYEYLYFHCIPSPATIYREVSRLVPATHAIAAGGAVRTAWHWQPASPAAGPRDLAAQSARFRALVRAAVATEAGAGEALGCFLSGGTDSSTVVGMLRDATGAARTYSIGFAADGYDEMEYARIAARHFASDHHEYYVTADDVAAEAPTVARSFDQPFGNSSALPAYLCARLAHADGVSRMLAGDGGDELFGGNARYRLQMALGAYEALPRTLRAITDPLGTGSPGRTRLPGLRHAAAYVRHARTPMPDRLEGFNLLDRVGAANVLAPDVLADVDEAAPRAARRATYARSTAPDLLDRILQYEWKYTLADSDLPKVRGATALAGVGVGYPLLYDEIVDFSLSLPAQWKVRRLTLRWFFKRALADFLPAAIIAKKKHGFGLPFGVWASRHAALRALAGDSLAGLERRGILRAGFRDPLLDDLMPAHPAYYGELIWVLMMLEQWLAAHERRGAHEL